MLGEQKSPTQCVAVSWPGYWPSYWQTPYLEVSWQGSFADQSTQGNGLQYKRNRFYDPNTGRFTQEDPIGLCSDGDWICELAKGLYEATGFALGFAHGGTEGGRMGRSIQSWIVNGVTSQVDDLHVDEIDKKYEDPSSWLQGAVVCLREAIRIRDADRLPLTMAIGFSLTSHREPVGLSCDHLDGIRSAFDGTPPSLYRFAKGEEPWIHEIGYQELPAMFHPKDIPGARSFFVERFDEGDREYRRVLWIAG